MTVAAGARSSTVGDGTTTAFTATFRADPDSATKGVGVVLETIADGTITAQTYNVDYTVALDSDNIPTITFVTAPASTYNVILYPNPDYDQDVAPTPGGPLFGSTVEGGLDDVLTLIQALDDRVSQCVRFVQAGAAVDALTILKDLKDKYLYFNATTGQPEGKAIATIQAELGTLDADLAAIAALTPSNDDIIQRKSGAWTNRTLAQLWADLDGIMPDSLRYASDTDTGLTRSGANTQQVTCGNTAVAQFDANGLTLPVQPAFAAYLATDLSNVTGDGTAYTIISWTEIYDRNSDFVPATGTFTAPVTGIYDFGGELAILAAGSATSVRIELVCTGGTYRVYDLAGGAIDISNNFTAPWTAIGIPLAATDTVTLRITVTGEGADTTDLDGDSAHISRWAGRLVA